MQITAPDVDPGAGLVALSENFVDLAGLIAQNFCHLAAQGSSFTLIGRGGLPANPSEPLTSAPVAVEWAAREEWDLGHSGTPSRRTIASPIPNQKFKIPNQIVEATGWTVAPDGTVILTASAPQVTPSSPGFTPPGCR